MFYVQMQIDLEVIINGLRMPSYLMHWPFPSVEENLHAEIFRSFGFSKTAGLVYQNASCFSFSMNHLAPINIYLWFYYNHFFFCIHVFLEAYKVVSKPENSNILTSLNLANDAHRTPIHRISPSEMCLILKTKNKSK